MPFRRESQFSVGQEALAAFARALSHPARVAIVHFLQGREEATCGEVVAVLPLAQATVSQHLGALRRAGIIRARECGTRVCYSLNREVIESMCGVFRGQLMGREAEAEAEEAISL